MVIRQWTEAISDPTALWWTPTEHTRYVVCGKGEQKVILVLKCVKQIQKLNEQKHVMNITDRRPVFDTAQIHLLETCIKHWH